MGSPKFGEAPVPSRFAAMLTHVPKKRFEAIKITEFYDTCKNGIKSKN